jgi:hypothetical protein
MKILFIYILILFNFISYSYASESNNEKTVIFIRHGEKPLNVEIGQINCKGLNRSLKLPKVLVQKFGKPNFIFAPNPSDQIEKKQQKFSYNRPLSTIEPTAIQLGLPTNTLFGFTDVKGFSNEILSEKYNNSLIFVSWEHNKLVEIVKYIYTKDKNNKETDIPDWPTIKYDDIYILKIKKENSSYQIKFTQDKQNLDNQSEVCPFPIDSK